MKYILASELKIIAGLCDKLNDGLGRDVTFAGNVYDANGDVLGVIELTDAAEYGLVLEKEYADVSGTEN